MFDKLSLLTRWMAREEWRMHGTLFGDGRFAGFPLVLFSLSAIAAFSLAHLGLGLSAIGLGAIVIAAILGVQTGSTSFEGDDAIENLLGDVTLLMYSSRTLPISGRTALGAFLLKDLVYYAVLFILPIVLGTFTGVWVEAQLFPSEVLIMCLNCGPIETYTTTGLTMLGVRTWILATGAFLGGVLVALVVAGIPIKGRAVQRTRSDTRTQQDQFGWLATRFGGTTTASLAAKTVLDVHRSSGGVWKLGLSSAGLMAGAYVVVELVAKHVPIAPSYGVLFGALVSVTAFPTYAWVTRIDDPGDYRLYPVSMDSLFHAKALAFAALELPVVVLYYAIVLLALTPSLLDVLVGGIVLAGMLGYVFGVTVYLTRFQPSEYLFDSLVFTKYALAVMVALLPVLMVGLFLSVTPTLGGALSAFAVVVGVIGWLLFHRTVTQADDALQPTAR